MSQDSCPLPTRPSDQQAAIIARFLSARRIAIVGLSSDPARASHGVASYLLSHGYQILPVNPHCTDVLGQRCHASLDAIKGQFDVVDVFRKSEVCADVTKEAIAAGAQGVWLQSGITSDVARQLAEAAGIDYIENRCIMVDHMRS